ATAADGVLRRGNWEASSTRDVVAALRTQGFLVLDVREEHRRRSWRTFWSAQTARASTVERVLLARHLALMLRAGLTVDRAFQILSAQATHKKGLERALLAVHADIQHGEALSVACARFPKVFPMLFVSILRWGEAGGSLPESLERLAVQLEKDLQLRRSVRGALIYPAIVIGATLILGVVLSTFVLPRLLTVFESFQLDLPLMTRIFLVIARGISQYGVRILAIAVLLLATLTFLSRLSSVRPPIHRAFLALPVIGRIVRQVNLARTERILGSLIRSGIPIVEALGITSTAVGNLRFQEVLREVLAQAQRGLPISGILSKYPRLFPPIHSQMVAVGEETGKMQEVLLYLADFTEEEVAQMTKNLTTTLEPILLVFVGLVVGGVALAIITPIYQLTGSLTQ
ncbi:MAG: type II secretion system F family protein, partial [bacterium]|nr:type II secretion system F family protein [bacterium]